MEGFIFGPVKKRGPQYGTEFALQVQAPNSGTPNDKVAISAHGKKTRRSH